MKNSKTKKAVVKETVDVIEKTPVEIVAPVITVEIVAEYVSKDEKLKSVVRRNKSSSSYEIDFYKANNVIATESYAFHTLRYHEEAAENYVNGIKKLDESKVP